MGGPEADSKARRLQRSRFSIYSLYVYVRNPVACLVRLWKGLGYAECLKLLSLLGCREGEGDAWILRQMTRE